MDDSTGSTREYSTIQAAADAAQPGDTVLVFSGTYAGFRVNRSGSSTAPITFKTSGTVTINSGSSTGDGIYLSRVSYVTIDGFKIQNVSRSCIAARDATATSPVTGLVVRNTSCTGAASLAGLYFSQVSNSLIENNTITGLNKDRVHGIYLANAGSDNTRIRGNSITGITGYDAAGIHMNGDASVGGDGLIKGVVIESNTIGNIGFNGISMDGVQSSSIINNVIYKTGRHGVRGFQIDGSAGPRSMIFVNNTIYAPGGWAVKLSEDAGSHRFFNNVLLTASSSAGSISVGTTSGLMSNYNAVVDRLSRDDENSIISFSQWKAAGFDANSFVSAPTALFTDIATNKYNLKPGAPAIDRGVASYASISAPSIDRLGSRRPQGSSHDIGGYESSSSTSPPGDTIAPSASITGPSSGATISGAVTVTANASDNVAVASVQFQLDGANLGSADTTAPYSIAWNTAQSANSAHSLRAIARDAAGNSTTSSAVSITVNNATAPAPVPTPTTAPTSTSITSSLNPAQLSQAVTFRATVSPSTATGTVQFFDGTAALASVALVNGSATYTTSNLSAASHVVRASYTGNSTYAASSAALTQTVNSTSGNCAAANTHCVGSGREFTSLQSAANAAMPGDTVIAYPGTYSGFRVDRSGTASAPITFKISGTTGSVVISSASSTGDGIHLGNVDYVVIDGFSIQNVGEACIAARGAQPTSPMTHLTIRNNICTKAQGLAGLYLSEVAQSLVENNTIFGLNTYRTHGIYLANAGSDNTTLRHNTIYSITGDQGAGIHMNGDLSVGGDGIMTGIILDGNMIYDINFNAFSMDGVQNSTVQNNVVFRTARYALRGFQIDGAAGPKGMKLINNTFHAGSGSEFAVKFSEDGGNHTVFNNVLFSGGGSIAIGNRTGFRSANNAVMDRFSFDEGSSTVSLSQWKSSGFDANSFVSTPATLFVNPSATDYHLKSGASAINTGVASFNGLTAAANDRDGKPRPSSGVDIGAYER